MKHLKFLMSFVLVLCLLLALSAPAYAAGEEYSYRIRIYDGMSGDLVMNKEFSHKDSVSLNNFFDNGKVVGKYYIRGLHLAGQDNRQDASLYINSIDADADYVLSYGFSGNMVAYYVRYVEAGTGDPLYPDDGYGNALNWEEGPFYAGRGDKIVVPCRQVVGYQPQAYNLTKTLVEDESQNIFTFIYTPEAEAAPAPVAPAPGEVVTDQAPNVVLPDGGVPAANQPQDIIDLDEEDTPLGLLDLGKDAVENGAQLLNALPFGARVGLIGLDLVVIGLIVWAIVYAARRRKEQKEDNA